MKNINLLLLFFCSIFFHAQKINPQLLEKPWRAYWIQANNTKPQDYGVYKFRKEFVLKDTPSQFIIHVSADNRYKLFVNGTQVSIGPARGDLHHWNFETVDVAPYLSNGKNVIAALVWNDGTNKALAQITSRTAFILQGDGDTEKEINTNKSWKAIQDFSFANSKSEVLGFFVAPVDEFTDFNKAINNWENKDFDDSSWKEAKTISVGYPKGVNNMGANDWMLTPSEIPQLEQKIERLQITRLSKGILIPEGFPKSKKSLTIPANSKVEVLLDQTYLTNAYPNIQFSKGKNASIVLKFAESLYEPKTMAKNNRNDVEGKKIIGVKDSIISNGDVLQKFTGLNWRTFRYVQLKIETKDQPLILDDIYGTFTGYPFDNKSEIVSSNPIINKVLAIGWRTARLCAVETYMDCPYYEQLQYIGDARIQAMVSYFNSGDDRLAKQAINAINNSRLAEGVTQSRYPATGDNIIPPFSLLWVGMVKDFYDYRNDMSFVKQQLPAIRQILSFYEKYQKADGTIAYSPYWNFVDWPENTKAWKMGTPPLNKDGGSALLDLQLLLAFQWASILENDLGNKGLSKYYSEKSFQLKQSIKSKYWDDTKQMIADNETKTNFSQQANALAILAEVLKDNEAKDAFLVSAKDDTVAKASIYFQYYINQALNKIGLGDEYLDHLQVWQDYINLGMTTWGEDSHLLTTRSDCHAWGASPNIEFFRILLGIDSAAPSFSKVKIEPNLGNIKNIKGKIPHPNGEIKVDYSIDKKGVLKAKILLPNNVDGIFIWKGKNVKLVGGENQIIL